MFASTSALRMGGSQSGSRGEFDLQTVVDERVDRKSFEIKANLRQRRTLARYRACPPG